MWNPEREFIEQANNLEKIKGCANLKRSHRTGDVVAAFISGWLNPDRRTDPAKFCLDVIEHGFISTSNFYAEHRSFAVEINAAIGIDKTGEPRTEIIHGDIISRLRNCFAIVTLKHHVY